MTRRRALIVVTFFPPLAGGGVHRVLGFVRYLPPLGWDCTVVCAGPSDYWVTDPSLEARVPPETEVLRVSGGSALSAWMRLRPNAGGRRSGPEFALLRRLSDWWLLPDSYAGWARRAARTVARRLSRGDVNVLITSSPPDSTHLVGLDTRGLGPVPWVADFRDPWMGLELRTPPTAWHRRRQRRMEADVIRRADLLLAASKTHADRLRERLAGDGSDPERVVHLPNGFEPSPEAPAGDAAPPSGTFLLAFTGTLSKMPDVEVFLEALHDLLAARPEARRRLRARLMGPYETGYADRAVALGLTGIVEFLGPRAHAEARSLQRSAHVLLHWQPRRFPTMVPGKLYEYFESGRPVVAVLDPGIEAAELVRAAGGVVVAPGDRAALTAELMRRYADWRGDRAPAVARPDWLEQHRRERLAGRLASLLDRLVGVPA